MHVLVFAETAFRECLKRMILPFRIWKYSDLLRRYVSRETWFLICHGFVCRVTAGGKGYADVVAPLGKHRPYWNSGRGVKQKLGGGVLCVVSAIFVHLQWVGVLWLKNAPPAIQVIMHASQRCVPRKTLLRILWNITYPRDLASSCIL